MCGGSFSSIELLEVKREKEGEGERGKGWGSALLSFPFHSIPFRSAPFRSMEKFLPFLHCASFHVIWEKSKGKISGSFMSLN